MPRREEISQRLQIALEFRAIVQIVARLQAFVARQAILFRRTQRRIQARRGSATALNGSEVVDARGMGYLYIPLWEYVKPRRIGLRAAGQDPALDRGAGLAQGERDHLVRVRVVVEHPDAHAGQRALVGLRALGRRHVEPDHVHRGCWEELRMTLPQGAVLIQAFVQVNLSTDAVAKPVSIAPSSTACLARPVR